ncbi:PD-(D/E)XK nuclease family protein [Pseudomonas sp.]|uniref:PDDEXK-like family protein n=1 Tax=Pseudomonas sp. TaxID=306 RepID=UPI001AFD0886|nr:PD-(D/E)XK nuclease family protein [Pseudomonas sp.]MBO9548468.1 PD-(D/E)XK nuclease family protein [Pseudomonas sp.]
MLNLINRAAVLRAEHHRPPSFNLFTLLRSASDEVRLHSRFLAFLLDPQGAHNAGAKPLQSLLEGLGIAHFDCRGATVQVEYRNIDILIRNSKQQAIILENKIHAEDQHEQLYRYVKTLQSEGFQQIDTLYLTLDGEDADSKSCKGIDYHRVSYSSDILEWLERCQAWVVREAAVRESLLQYIDLIRKLTSKDQGQKYMDMLKQTLLKDKNLLLVKDLQKAYMETLKDLQLALWQDVVEQVKQKYPELPAPCEAPTASIIDRYYSTAKNNKYYGLSYSLGFMPGSIYLELNHRFYTGYSCDVETYPHEHARLKALGEVVPNNGNTSNGLFWRYCTELNMKSPSDDHLEVLLDARSRSETAARMADDLHYLWRTARELCTEG